MPILFLLYPQVKFRPVFCVPGKKCAKYRKLPYFTYEFGGFLGEDLGESYPPNAM